MRRENERRSDVVSGANELFEAPPQDRFCLRLVDQFELGRSHCRLPLRLRLQGHSSASSARLSARLRSRVAAPKVWVPPTNVPRPSDGLPRSSVDGARRSPRHATRSPHPAPCPPGLIERGEQLCSMPAAIAAEEVRSRSTAANELDVDVSRVADDVAKKSSVAIDVVECPIPLELHRCARRRQVARARASTHARSIRPRRARGHRPGRAARAARFARRACPRRRHASRRRFRSLLRWTKTRTRRAPRQQQRGAGSAQTGRELVDAGALRLFLAIHVPRDEQQPAEDDDQEAAPRPTLNQIRSKITMPSTPMNRKSDRRARQLEAVARHAASLRRLRDLVASGGRNGVVTKPLWAPWRLEYIKQADEQVGCVFCDEAAGALDPDDSLLVHQRRHGDRAPEQVPVLVRTPDGRAAPPSSERYPI